jgi:fatty-acyl-CoA synthase
MVQQRTGRSTTSVFEQSLDRRPANHLPLSPISPLTRSARIYPNRIAAIHGECRFTYGQFLDRARQLASSLAQAG